MRIVCIVGPTASGKTAAAVTLAERVGGEILSCDSVAIYRGLDIGSAKPTVQERRRVRHHLLDIAEPSERFSAARWASLAEAAAREIAARGRPVVVAGGTGLYLRAWLFGLAPTPPADAALRAAHAATPLPLLYARLQESDPETAAAVGPRDFVRISRALEIQAQTGVPASLWRRQHRRPPLHELRFYGLAPPREELRARIDARVDAMIAAGLPAEVAELRRAHGSQAPALRSLGYAQLSAHHDGIGTLEEATAEIKRATRLYARRQLTWFRGEQVPVAWYPSAEMVPLDEAARFLEGGVPGSTYGHQEV